jgi:hypothetical protein
MAFTLSPPNVSEGQRRRSRSVAQREGGGRIEFDYSIVFKNAACGKEPLSILHLSRYSTFPQALLTSLYVTQYVLNCA